ncbi:phospholipid scramblase 1 [Entomortierella lignicola]|nr:phospholipid scramblase 1 [Entomortierella lignicola]KAF9200898.1 phospholipid scramblase 1 [Haplosporangium sp. Z 27]
MTASLKKQKYYFFLFLAVYTLTGIGALVLGRTWLSQAEAGGAPREAVISRVIEQVGTYLGAVVAATAVVGLIGGIAPIRFKKFLLTFVILIIAVMMAELGLGGVIWFKTLRMRSTYQTQWLTWSDSLRAAFQDMTSVSGYGQCCGYLQNTNVVLSGLCADPNQQFPGCEEKVSAFADGYLRKLFTSLFGFTIVNVVLFVTTVILIQTRNDEERYIRIRRKEGRTYTNVI